MKTKKEKTNKQNFAREKIRANEFVLLDFTEKLSKEVILKSRIY